MQQYFCVATDVKNLLGARVTMDHAEARIGTQGGRCYYWNKGWRYWVASGVQLVQFQVLYLLGEAAMWSLDWERL